MDDEESKAVDFGMALLMIKFVALGLLLLYLYAPTDLGPLSPPV